MITFLCILGWLVGAGVTSGLVVLLDNLCIIDSATAEGLLIANLVFWPLVLFCLVLYIPLAFLVVTWLEFWNLFR
jgi:hypothetical protein